MSLRPTSRFLAVLGVWALLGLASGWWPEGRGIWLGFGGLVFLVALIEMALLFSGGQVRVERNLPGRFALGVAGRVKLKVVNRRRRTVEVEVFDGIPVEGEAEELPWHGRVPGRGFTELSYPVTLKERGELVFSPTQLLERSPLGLWKRFWVLGEEETTKVYPNYEPVLRYALLAMEHRQEQMGVVRKNRAGMSREFHQLRDYQVGDPLATIDWKASSKRRELITRAYQEQRDQTVIIMVDCGRRMRAMDGKLSQFDHTLNAILFLSYLALRQGDHVGLLSFGGTDRWLPPVKGASAMTRVLNHLYDYETAPFPSDFAEAAERLLRHQRKRAMVVVLTNLRGEDAEDLVEPLRKIRQKHLVVLGSLRESAIDDYLDAEIGGLDDALAYLAMRDYLRERKAVLDSLTAHGIMSIDRSAQEFPVALANRYLASREAV